MASHDVSQVPGDHMRFGSLDFFITTEGELAWAPAPVQPLHSAGLDAIVEAFKELQLHAPEAHAPRSDQLLGFDYERLERQLDAFLGPRPSRKGLCCLAFSFANVMTQVAGGELLSLEYLARNAPTAFPFGMHNTVRTFDHLTAQRTHPSPTDDELVGMTDYVAESFHDLLTGDSQAISDSDSSRGAITPRENASWQVPPKGASKASTRERLLLWTTPTTRSRKMQGPRLACGWSS